jgi:aryl-alcohol dehydrogenase-like predicted oxidoreductase
MSESTTFDADDWRGKSPDFAAETFRRNLAVVERLKGFARQKDISLPQLAVAWNAGQPRRARRHRGRAAALPAGRDRPSGRH